MVNERVSVSATRQKHITQLQQPFDEGSEIGLQELFRTLWRRKMLLIGCMIVITSIAALVVMQLTPRFSSSALLMIETRRKQVVDVEAVLSGLSLDAALVQGEVEVLKSRSLAARVVERLGLMYVPEFNGELPEGDGRSSLFGLAGLLPEDWRRVIQGPPRRATGSEEEQLARATINAVQSLSQMMSVGPMGRSLAIRVGITSEDPELAALIVNTTIEQYIANQLEAKNSATRQASSWLNEKIPAMREKLRQSERAVEDYRAKLGLVNGRTTAVTAQQISEISSQVILAQSARVETEARLRNVQELLSSGGDMETVAEVLTSPLIMKLREQEATVMRQAAELASRYGERHPKMIKARVEAEDLRGKIESEVRNIIQSLANEVEIVRIREESLRGNLDELKQLASRHNQAEIKLRELEREATANRSLYEAFLARFKETSGQEDLQHADARFLSRAVVPELSSYPNRKLIIGIALIGSIFMGLLLVFVLERLDNCLRSGEEIERLTGFPVISMIPISKGPGKLKGMLGHGRDRVEDQVIIKPASAFSESLRSLHTALQLSSVKEPPKVICVTSSVSSEGKTLISASLSRIAAMSGQRVLVIDCDMRRPAQHRTFGMGAGGNIVDLLTGAKSLEEVISIDEGTGVHTVTSRVYERNPLDLLGSQRFKDLVAEFRQNYDLVILDTPAILAVSDARIIALDADKTVFVIKWDGTPREAVFAGIRQLADIGVDFAGIVLSMVNVKRHARYGYGDMAYYYGRYREYYVE